MWPFHFSMSCSSCRACISEGQSCSSFSQHHRTIHSHTQPRKTAIVCHGGLQAADWVEPGDSRVYGDKGQPQLLQKLTCHANPCTTTNPCQDHPPCMRLHAVQACASTCMRNLHPRQDHTCSACACMSKSMHAQPQHRLHPSSSPGVHTHSV
jgi:hypothetical protein